MAVGPGKYDEACTAARETCAAQGVILIVVGGIHGNGFSVQGPIELQLALPRMLRHTADLIDADLEQLRDQ